LPVGYYHLVFSVPHELVPLMWQNKRQLFSLLFEASAATLLDVAADPKHLGAQTGFLSILHTWGQTLTPASRTSTAWCRAEDSRPITRAGSLPVTASCCQSRCSGRVFRGKFVAGLRALLCPRSVALLRLSACRSTNDKRFAMFLRARSIWQDWVVYAKHPSRLRHVLHYLARYTHRVAISNQRPALGLSC